MSPEEFWWLYEFKKPKDKAKSLAGSLTQADAEELYADLVRAGG